MAAARAAYMSVTTGTPLTAGDSLLRYNMFMEDSPHAPDQSAAETHSADTADTTQLQLLQSLDEEDGTDKEGETPTTPTTPSTETIQVNVSGQKFELFRSTLERAPQVMEKLLADGVKREDHYGKTEYYFDRDAEIFRYVVLYCRFGQMHVPNNVCGPVIERELKLWGLQVGINLERCCFGHVMETKVQLMSLKRFEDAFKESSNDDDLLIQERGKFHRGWYKVRNAIWNVVDKPDSSIIASAYATVLSLTVVLAVIIFVAKTAVPEDVFFNKDDHAHLNATEMPFNFSLLSNSTMSPYTPTTPLPSTTEHTHLPPPINISRTKTLWLDVVDYLCVGVFSVDFFTRLLIAPDRCQHMQNTYTIIDLLSIVPFYFELIGPAITIQYNIYTVWLDFTVGSMVEFLKISLIFRLLRIGRHYVGLQVLMYTLKTSVKDLLLMVVFVFLGTLFFATMLYFLEKKNIKSIPLGFWWALITMTTVGYGDYVPKTPLGMSVGCCCAMSGVLLIAFTVPILVNHFMLYYSHAQIVVQSQSAHKLARKELINRMKNVKEKVAGKAILKNVNKQLSSMKYLPSIIKGRGSTTTNTTSNPDDTMKSNTPPNRTPTPTLKRNSHTMIKKSVPQSYNSSVSLDQQTYYTVSEPGTPILCSRCRRMTTQTVTFYDPTSW